MPTFGQKGADDMEASPPPTPPAYKADADDEARPPLKEPLTFEGVSDAATSAPRPKPSQLNPKLNDSRCAYLSESHWFQTTTLVVIVLNALWIGVDVQANNPRLKKDGKLPLEPTSTVIENLFCGYFSIELALRFLSFRRKIDCMKDGWFVFDGLLVLFMVIETWIIAIAAAIAGGKSDGFLSKLSALRLLRLLRLTRMARLMKEVPELLTLVKGMLNAAKAVSFILMFLILCMYVFAIVMTSQLGDPKAPEHKYAEGYWVTDSDPTGVELFGTLGDSMMTLFTRGVLADNLAETMQAIKDRGGKIKCDEGVDPDAEVCERTGGSLLLLWVFIAFFIISAFCLLNMLIGVLCEVIQDSAEKENETNQISDLRQQMSDAFAMIDTSQDGLITPHEWTSMSKNQNVRRSMASLGVEEKHMDESLGQMAETLFGEVTEELEPLVPSTSSRHGLTFEQFISKVVEIRPDTPASALDIEVLRIRVEREEREFNHKLDVIEDALATTMPDASLLPPSRQATNTGGTPAVPLLPAKLDGKAKPLLIDPETLVREAPTEVLFAVLESRGHPSSQAFLRHPN